MALDTLSVSLKEDTEVLLARVVLNGLAEASHRLQIKLTLVHQETCLDILALLLTKRAFFEICLNLECLLLVVNSFDDLLPSAVSLDRLLFNCCNHVIKVCLQELKAFRLHEGQHHVDEH